MYIVSFVDINIMFMLFHFGLLRDYILSRFIWNFNRICKAFLGFDAERIKVSDIQNNLLNFFV